MKYFIPIILIFYSFEFLNGQCFLTGADLSYTNEIINKGGVYKDENGEEVDPFEYFAKRGTKIVRLRLWHTPSNIIDNCGEEITSSSLSDVLDSALKVKQNGMQLKLSIHYSDYFADPGKQKRPLAWEGISQIDLLDSIANYTERILDEFYNQNTIPDIVSVGNETTWGFIDDTNTTDGFNWNLDREKFNRALSTIDLFNEEKNTDIKKALHFTESGVEWAMNEFVENGVNNFDIIGFSYYPFFSPNTSINEIGELVRALSTNYEKEVMIFETGYAWTAENGDDYTNFISHNGDVLNYSMDEEGQLAYLLDLSEAIFENNGMGLIYWEPAWISSNLCDQWGQGSSYENVAMYDIENNEPLESFNYFEYCGAEVKTENINEAEIKIYPNPITSNVLMIESESLIKKWEILDMGGKVLIGREIQTEKNLRVLIPDSFQGIYLLKIENKFGTTIKKIIL